MNVSNSRATLAAFLGVLALASAAWTASSENYIGQFGFPVSGGGEAGSASYDTSIAIGSVFYINVSWSIRPQTPIVSIGEYLHFTTPFSGSEVWSVISDGSSCSITADSGIYQAGPVGSDGDEVVDIIYVSVNGHGAFNPTTVHITSRSGGTVGPATSMDIDGNSVGIGDVVLMLRRVVGLDTFTAEQEEAGDFNVTGAVDISDVVNALRVTVGLDPNL